MKRPLTECEKIFTNNMSDKELISKKIQKIFILFNITKTNNLINKWVKDLRDIFKEEEIQMGT